MVTKSREQMQRVKGLKARRRYSFSKHPSNATRICISLMLIQTRRMMHLLVGIRPLPQILLTERCRHLGSPAERKDNLRSKALSGTLYVTVRSAHELEHAP